jgi:hypothetical protein
VAPLVVGGLTIAWSTIAWTTAQVGLTAWQINEIWGDEDPGKALEGQANPGEVAACLASYAEGGALTAGARAYYLDELQGWRARGAEELAGNAPALASFTKTIDNLAQLYKQPDDGTGVPVGLCHVQAGAMILERQLATLTQTPAAQIPPVAAQGVPAGRPRSFRWWPMVAALGGLVGALYFWRKP